MTRPEVLELIERFKRSLDELGCGAFLIIGDGKQGTVDVEVCTNLNRESQRRVLRHALERVEEGGGH
ncbi:MAG TPA: hypothetical protein VFJ64_10815 [Solirubrobacterales bacterium]|nr:hypothetical protein [Solirubrobacterales bacterium]